MKFQQLYWLCFLIWLSPLSEVKSQIYYVPNEGHLLALDNKYNCSISAGIGASEEKGGSTSFQVGFSPIKHLGLQGAYTRTHQTYFSDSRSTVGYNYNGAIGSYYFLPFKNTKAQSEISLSQYKRTAGVLFDLYLGYGRGNVDSKYDELRSSKLNFQKTYIQGGAHFQGGILGLQIVLKTGFLDFIDGSYTDVYNQSGEDTPLESFTDILAYEPYRFMEGTFRLSLGIKQGRIFFSQTIIKTSDADNISILDNSFHFGFLVEIDKLLKIRKK